MIVCVLLVSNSQRVLSHRAGRSRGRSPRDRPARRDSALVIARRGETTPSGV